MANTIDGRGSQFFPDQQVHAPDLNNIQYSSIHSFRNYLKGITKTPGVYLNTTDDTPLRVTCSNDGVFLSILPGTGVDSEGRIIQVPSSAAVSGSLSVDPLYYPARPSTTLFSPAVGAAGTYYVNLYYNTIYGSTEPDDSGEQFPTRAYDSYRIKVEQTRAVGPGLTLARGDFTASGSLSQTTLTGGYVTPTGVQYALFDERVGYEVYDEQKGDTVTSVNQLRTAVFEEELEKSVGFVFPADGHSIVTKIHRNATIIRMELYMELQTNETGTVQFSFYSGSTANTWRTGPITLATSTPDVFTQGSLLNMNYTANHPMKFELSRADDSVTRATAVIVYKRR